MFGKVSFLCAYLNIRYAYLASAGQSLTFPSVTLRVPPVSFFTRPRGKRLSWASICFQFIHALAFGTIAIKMTPQPEIGDLTPVRRPLAAGLACVLGGRSSQVVILLLLFYISLVGIFVH